MIKGIPYFGENTQEIYEKALNKKDIDKVIKYESLYDAVQDLLNKHIIVIIHNKWLTWFNDIVFNYKDKECYIPYYTYDTLWENNRVYRGNNKGHILTRGDSIGIRYNYNYKKYYINVVNLLLTCYNVDTEEFFCITTNKWINDSELNLDKLYRLYLNSCYKDDDFITNKHSGGYHYIVKSAETFKNKEKELREKLGLQHYDKECKHDKDYRDIREYTYEQVVHMEGMQDNSELYRERRVRFESYLYCCIQGGLKPLDNNEFEQLLNGSKHIVKIGKVIRLVIKDYWFSESNILKNKTWSI